MLILAGAPGFMLPAAGQSPLRFKSLTPAEGLSQASALSIVQDRQGFIWIGTQNGLNRYDGYQVTVFRPNPDDPHSIIDNYVPLVAAHPDGSIWASSSRGVFSRYDPVHDRFDRFPIRPDSLAGGNVYKFTITTRGEIFALVHGRLFQRSDSIIGLYPGLPDRLQQETLLRTLTSDRDGRLWVSDTNRTVYRIDPERGITGTFPLPPLGGNPPPIFNQSGESRDGRIWLLAHYQLLCRIDPESGDAHYVIPAPPEDLPFPGGVAIVPHRDHRSCD
ncbi:MAG: hypothetical protein KDM81_18470 [Verrucomicrobiae bacterium]|nr:hypothetical protein [Verrucomicrobiae bacterium]